MTLMSRTRRATWNYLGALLFTGVTLAAGLVATPYLVGWLTPARFGAFRMLTEWSGALALLELGLGGALQPLLARGWAGGTRTSSAGRWRPGSGPMRG